MTMESTRYRKQLGWIAILIAYYVIPGAKVAAFEQKILQPSTSHLISFLLVNFQLNNLCSFSPVAPKIFSCLLPCRHQAMLFLLFSQALVLSYVIQTDELAVLSYRLKGRSLALVAKMRSSALIMCQSTRGMCKFHPCFYTLLSRFLAARQIE